MTKLVLGVDTSCYTTSAAVVDTDGHLLAESRRMLMVPQGSRGLRQSEAVFQHLRNLPDMLSDLKLSTFLPQLSAVCVSNSPRDAEGSYMPVFQVGVAFATTIAHTANIPFYSSNHQDGHLAAAAWSCGQSVDSLLAVHLSGGTTELLLTQNGQHRLIAATGDISAGQYIDRVGVALGLPFPAGAHLDQMALGYHGKDLSIPTSVRDGQCSFSGAETRTLALIGQESPETIAVSAFSCVLRTLDKMLEDATKKIGVKNVLLMGGVAASQFLRLRLPERIKERRRSYSVSFADAAYSGDNAVGVALIGVNKLRGEELNGTDY